eukprot:gb/GEZN01001462.1/.p1 GENE.gb/GEZN01001462.1/~~gb/GEZN01001462.1/.p1  ORF type:complete len:893 (-),score=182.03 gb/GEZN01001462.1/:145-2823(-)
MDDLFGDLADEAPALSMDTTLGVLSASSSPNKPGSSTPVNGMNGGLNGIDPVRKGSDPTPRLAPPLHQPRKASEPMQMPSFAGSAFATKLAPSSGSATPPNNELFPSSKKEENGQAVFHSAPKISPGVSPSISLRSITSAPPTSISSLANNHSSAMTSPLKSTSTALPSPLPSSPSSLPSSPTSNHSLPSSPDKPAGTQEANTIPSSPEQAVQLLQAERARSDQLAAANQILESKVVLARKKAESVHREALARHSAEITKLKGTFSQWAAKKKTEFLAVQTKLASAVTKGRQLITENAQLKSDLATVRRQNQDMEEQLKKLGVEVESTKLSKEKDEAAIVKVKSSYESELTELADALLQANQQLSAYESNEDVKRNVNVNISPTSQPITDSPLKVEISIEGEYTVQWLRSFRGSSFQKIQGALSTQKTYHPTVDDIGATLRVEVRTVSGVELGAETGPVKCNPKMYPQLLDLLKVDIRKHLKDHVFVVQSLGSAVESKKESLLLSKDKIKLKANNKTYAKSAYSEELKVVLDDNTRRAFTVYFGSKAEPAEEAKPQQFTAGSGMQRDVIVLSVRLYNLLQVTQKMNKTPEQQCMLDEYIREVTNRGKKDAVDSFTLLSRQYDMQVPYGLEASVSRNKSLAPVDGLPTRRSNSTSNVLAIAQRRTSFTGGVAPGSLLPKSVDAMMKTEESGLDDSNYDIGNIRGGSTGMFVVEPNKKTKEELEEEAKKKAGRDGVSNSAWDDIGGAGAHDDEKWSDDEEEKNETKTNIKVTIDMSKEVKQASGDELKMMVLGVSPQSLTMGTAKKKKKKKTGAKKGSAVQTLDMNAIPPSTPAGAGQSAADNATPTSAEIVTSSPTSTISNTSPTFSAGGAVGDSSAPSTPEKEAGPNRTDVL